MVLSDDGWSWVYALRQLGVAWIWCMPLSERSRDQLMKIQDAIPGVTIVQPPMLPNTILPNLTVFEVDDDRTNVPQELGMQWKAGPTIVYVGKRLGRSKAAIFKLQTHLVVHPQDYLWGHSTVRHGPFGGLTNARVTIMWGSQRGCQFRMKDPDIQGSKRPMGAFLEARPTDSDWSWKAPYDGYWSLMEEDTTPLAWPFREGLVWIKAPSIFNKEPGRYVYRTLSRKERCQVLDIRQDLGTKHIEQIWQWRRRSPIPVRFLTEFVMQSIDWVRQSGNILDKSNLETADTKSGDSKWLPNIWEQVEQSSLRAGKFFAWVQDPTDALKVSKAVKADSAAVDTRMWDVGGQGEAHIWAREILRDFLHQVWRRRLTREATRWLQLQTMDREAEVGWNREGIRECVTRAANSTWWEWADGSRLFFWRWPDAWFKEARDGAKAFHYSFPKQRLFFPETPITEEWIRKLDEEKLEKLILRRYLEPTTAADLIVIIPRGQVSKGKDDIRIVWDLSRNGVNPTLFTPSFFLATVSTLARKLCAEDFQGDFDIGEQFHNFLLHPFERPLCGVRMPKRLVESLPGATTWMRWTRAPFGWSPSPYFTLRMLARALELAKGDLDDPENPFGWTTVKENYPCHPDYDPGQPRLVLIRKDGTRAVQCLAFFDDGRVFGPIECLIEKATRQVCANLQRKGIQDAARKRRPVDQRAGAWCGGVIHTDQGLPRKFVAQEKWDKTRAILQDLKEELATGVPISRQTFLQRRGFLVHISLTYDHFKPYLKGFHLTAESWRVGRDTQGWPTKTDKENTEENPLEDDLDPDLWECDDDFTPKREEQVSLPPPTVDPVPRLTTDVEALLSFTGNSTPTMILLRPVRSGTVSLAYGFGDASGEGFGGFMEMKEEAPVMRRGFWCREVAERSSNYRELRNLVEFVETLGRGGRLKGREVWLFTDNAVAESVFYKGSSTERSLFDLMLRLRHAAMDGQFILQLVHIAGTRMIQQGTDGLSRGETYLGDLLTPVDQIVPLHLTPMKRRPSLRKWIASWVPESFRIAESRHWFRAAQGWGEVGAEAQADVWVWDLPPAGALDALEELGTARLKRHDRLTGIVLIPLLLRPEWFRRFVKSVDVYFVLPPGALPDVWPKQMHEPLLIGLYFPLLRFKPWDWKNVQFMARLGRTLSTMHRIGDDEGRSLLREFWAARSWVATMPERMVSDLLSATSWHKLLGVARRRTGHGD